MILWPLTTTLFALNCGRCQRRASNLVKTRLLARVVDYEKSSGGTPLFKAIEERHWKSALSRTLHCPSDVSTYTKREGRFKSLPLHDACKRSPPASVVHSLLTAHKAAARTKCDGNLPLHYALKHGSSLDVIKMLLVAYPDGLHEANDGGDLPLDIAKQSVDDGNDDMKEIVSFLERAEKDGISDEDMAVDLSKERGSGDKSDDDDSDEQKEGDVDDGGLSDASELQKEESSVTTVSDITDSLEDEGWNKSGLIVVVVGASGDLAKKKTYPTLFRLHTDKLLPEDTVIYGFARSDMTDESLREKLKGLLSESCKHDEKTIDSFLSRCFYHRGEGYGDFDSIGKLAEKMKKYEDDLPDKLSHNRLFYFAVPPDSFSDVGKTIKKKAMADKGWTRVIVEKPFGKDLDSCNEILADLAENFEDETVYRIDHYLGKEMVRNLLALRFANSWLNKLWDRNSIQCVIITLKEPFGTEGRGGYFDQYGIIRDVIQNHLMQELCLLAMEAPPKVDGPEASEAIRDAKAHVLKSVPPVTIDDCFLGQYKGYTDDDSIENENSNTATYAAIRFFVNNPRWAGVPFIIKAGKALDEHKSEMRIQFKQAPAAEFMFNQFCPHNELVLQNRPREAIYFKMNVKSPGFGSSPVQSELKLNYSERYFSGCDDDNNPDAYTTLILDVLRGKSEFFLRADELRRSWEILTPILHKIEEENTKPVMYEKGSRGPEGADEFVCEKSGYVRNDGYIFDDGHFTTKEKKKKDENNQKKKNNEKEKNDEEE